MSDRTTILWTGALAVLCLIAGFLVGRLSGEATAPGPTAAPQETTAPPPPPATVVLEDLPFSIGFTDPGPGPTGDGTIVGSVTTEDGRPVEGVTVHAAPRFDDWNPDRSGGASDADPLLPEAREEIRQVVRTRRGTRVAVSRSDGSFRLTGLAGGEYSVRGYRKGWSVGSVGRGGHRAGDRVRLIARPVLLVEVDVRRPDGSRAGRARVEAGCTEERVRRNQTWTSEHPWIALKPGPATFRAFAGRGDPLASEEVEVELDADGSTGPVVLRLRERASIQGVLRYPSLDAFGRMPYRIVWLRIREEVPADPELLCHGWHGTSRFYTYSPRNGEGSFTITDVPPGRYLVGALVINGHHRVLASRVVTVGEGRADVELMVTPPGVGQTTIVRILTPKGIPVERSDLNLQSLFLGEDGATAGSSRAEYVGEGAFRVHRPIPAGGKTENGRYVIRIHSTPFGTRCVAYDPDAEETTIRLEEPARLTVAIPSFVGSRYEGFARVAVRRTEEGARAFPLEKRPGPRGRSLFSPLAPGEVVILLSVDSGKYGRDTVLEVPVTLRSGERKMTLDPPALYHLSIVEAESEDAYRLEPKDERHWRRADSREGERLKFLRLLAGDYVLWRTRKGVSSSMTFRLGQDAEIRFMERPR